jgi:hypothetical protein
MKQVFLAYEIVRQGQDRGARFYCRAENWESIDQHAIERESEIIRDRFDNIYLGTHIVIRYWETKQRNERCVRNRKESFDLRDLAFAEILDGPDTKTRRWLEKYLAQKNKKTSLTPRQTAIAAEKKEPVTIGQVIKEVVPF